MSIVSYNGKRLIPAPFINIAKSYTTSPDGKMIGAIWNIGVKGSVLTYKGSPDENNLFYTGSQYPPAPGQASPDYRVTLAENENLGHVLRKQEVIRKLFATEGLSFEVQSFDGSAPMKCNPRIKSITFPEGQWFDRFEYDMQLEADLITVNGVPLGEDSNSSGENIFTNYISALEDNWQIETLEEGESATILRSYRVSHTVSATGKRNYDENGVLVKEAWQQAKSAVIPRIGLDLDFLTMSGLGDIPVFFSGYNHVRSENINKTNGTYGITESWLMTSGNTIESFNIDVKKGIDSAFTRVAIQGIVRGLEIRDSGMNLISSKFHNASGKFNEIRGYASDRAKAYSSINRLHHIPVSQSFTMNPFDGTVQYSYEFDDRPSGLITHANNENITIQNNWGVDVFAAIPVLGRAKGPVLQSIHTKKETSRSLNIEFTFDKNLYIGDSGYSVLTIPHPRWRAPYSGDLQNIVNHAHPVSSFAPNNIGGVATRAYVSDQSENWNPNTLHYSYNVTWVYE